MTTQPRATRRARLTAGPRTWTVVKWFGLACAVAGVVGHLLGRLS
jgi:hypothetical protein